MYQQNIIHPVYIKVYGVFPIPEFYILSDTELYHISICQNSTLDDESPTHDRLATHWGFPVSYSGTKKVSILDGWRKEHGLDWSEIAYIGMYRSREPGIEHDTFQYVS